MATPYTKPWMSLADQVNKLKSRGLVVSDPTGATEYLGHVNYYRFAGYSLAFCSGQHHSRLWERLNQIKPVLPNTAEWKPPLLTDNGRLFCTLLLLRKITQRTKLMQTSSDRYRDKINTLLMNPPAVAHQEQPRL